MAALTNWEPEEVKPSHGWTEQSFLDFYDRHIDLVRGRVRSLVPARDVEDVVQDVFVRLYRKRHTFRGEAALSTWVRTVAHNASLMHLRMARVRRENITGDDTLHFLVDSIGERPSLTNEIRARRALEAVREAIPTLKAEQQLLLRMGGEERSMREIAEALDVSVACAKSRLYRARQELRDILPDRFDHGF